MNAAIPIAAVLAVRDFFLAFHNRTKSPSINDFVLPHNLPPPSVVTVRLDLIQGSFVGKFCFQLQNV